MEIDINVFMEIMKNALLAASNNGNGSTSETIDSSDIESENLGRTQEQSKILAGETPTIPSKKRGRPKKTKEEKSGKFNPKPVEKVVDSSPEIETFPLDDEDDDDVDLIEEDDTFEPPPPRQKKKFSAEYVASAQGTNYGNRVKAKTQTFEAPKGPNLFDVKGWGNLKKNDNVYLSGPNIGKPITTYPEGNFDRPPAQQVKIRCYQCSRKFKIFTSLLKPSCDGESRPIHYCNDCEKVRR